jgi:hypothetical protein
MFVSNPAQRAAAIQDFIGLKNVGLVFDKLFSVNQHNGLHCP